MRQNHRKYCILALSCACLAFAFNSCKKNNDTPVNSSVAILPTNAPVKGVKVKTEKLITIEARDIKVNTEKVGATCRTHSNCEAAMWGESVFDDLFYVHILG